MNSLLTTEYLMRIAQPMIDRQLSAIRRQAEMDDALIAAFLAEHPGVSIDDLVFEYRGFHIDDSPTPGMPFDLRGRRVRLLTPEEKWLNWLSDNHGWEPPT